MESFKFSCPDCGCHLEAEASAVGCLIECPSCSEELVVPNRNRSGLSLPTAKRSKHSPAPASAKPPEQPTDPAPVDLVLNQDMISEVPPAIPDHEGKMAHVGALTAPIKLEIVRWAFRRLENPAGWLPHAKLGGRLAYAARVGQNGLEPVSYDHPEARKYSLLGAVLLELKIQHASVAAQGREIFLDHEILNAVKKVLAKTSVATDGAEDPLGKLDHARTLDVLRLLENEYLRECEHLDDMMETARLPGVTMSELIQRAEKGELVTSNEVLSVLYHEVHLLNRRVEELENVIKTKLS